MSNQAPYTRRLFCHYFPTISQADRGITLVELLVGLVITGVVASAAGSVIIAQIQSSAKLELAQRQRDNSSRFNYLIQIEASEAASVIDTPALPEGCPGTGVVGFRIPRDQGQYLDVKNISTVYYANQGLDVWRCGPPVMRSGVLDHDPNAPIQAGVVVRDAQLKQVNCSGLVTNDEQLAYNLVFATGFEPSCSIARAKTLLVCNVGDVCD